VISAHPAPRDESNLQSGFPKMGGAQPRHDIYRTGRMSEISALDDGFV
jgi:hypothetical protein